MGRWYGSDWWRDVAAKGVKPGMEIGAPSAYEAVTRRMVESVADELKEIKGRLNGLLFMVAGAILIDLVLRLAG